MAERSFVIVRSVGKVPAMGSCANCELKFFTPATYTHDAIGADEYLRRKFDLPAGQPAERRFLPDSRVGQ